MPAIFDAILDVVWLMVLAIGFVMLAYQVRTAIGNEANPPQHVPIGPTWTEILIVLVSAVLIIGLAASWS